MVADSEGTGDIGRNATGHRDAIDLDPLSLQGGIEEGYCGRILSHSFGVIIGIVGLYRLLRARSQVRRPGVIANDVRIGRLDPELNRVIERSEEHTSELQSLMRISYAVFCLKKKKVTKQEQI